MNHDLVHCNRLLSKSDPPAIYVEGKSLNVGLDGLPKSYRALSNGKLELLKELIESGIEVINTPDSEGWPPFKAIKQGKLDCAAFVLKILSIEPETTTRTWIFQTVWRNTGQTRVRSAREFCFPG